MKRKTPRTAEEIAEIFDRHHRTVYRVCWSFLKNSADAEDAVQDAFLALIRSSPELESEEHEKAWLIRTASNLCINMLRSPRRKTEPLDETLQAVGTADLPVGEVLDAVLALPEKYKTAVYLYYYEGYDTAEIARMLSKPASTVRNHLREARKLLKERLGEDYLEE